MKFLAHKATKLSIDNFINSPSHALIIDGPRGSGRTFIANYIAAELLGTTPEKLDNYPYIMRLNSVEQDAGIDEIREITKFLRLKTTGKLKIRRFVIIDSAENLSIEAQNALLKILEEPPADTCITLNVANKNHIRPTVLSRSQSIKVRDVPFEQCESAFPDAPESKSKRNYILSEGRAGLFVALSQEDSEHTLVKSIAQAKNLLNKTRYQRMLGIDELLKDKSADLAGLVESFYKILHSVLVANVGSSDSKSAIQTKNRLKVVNKTRRLLDSKAQPKLALTYLFFNI